MLMSISKGVAFRTSSKFKEGDHIMIDGDKAIIVKIGLFVSIFGITRSDGYNWRYVPNQRLSILKIEKIISTIKKAD